jgi:hypothetical protein
MSSGVQAVFQFLPSFLRVLVSLSSLSPVPTDGISSLDKLHSEKEETRTVAFFNVYLVLSEEKPSLTCPTDFLLYPFAQNRVKCPLLSQPLAKGKRVSLVQISHSLSQGGGKLLPKQAQFSMRQEWCQEMAMGWAAPVASVEMLPCQGGNGQ